jgi:hypothetical protein
MNLAGSRIVGWVSLPAGKAAYKNADGMPDPLRLTQDCVRSSGIDLRGANYFGLNLVFNVEIGKTSGGRACLDPGRLSSCYGVTWLFPPSLGIPGRWAHDMGHALGLHHSGRDPGRTYGNIWDVMSEDGACGSEPGFGRIAQHIIAYDKDRLGWLLPDQKITVGEPGEWQFDLAPLAQQPAAGDRFQLAKIPIAGAQDHFYTVEARVRLGYDRYLPADAVVIHEMDARAEAEKPAGRVTLRWQSSPEGGAGGSVFYGQFGIRVTVEARTADAFHVTVLIAPGSGEQTAEPVPPRSILAAASQAREGTAAPASASEQASPWSSLASTRYTSPGQALVIEGPGRQHALRVVIEDGPSEAILYSERQAGQAQERAVALEQRAETGSIATPALAIGAGGAAYAAWAQLYGGLWRGRFALRAADGADWTRPEEIGSVQAGTAWAPALATDGQGNVYVLWVERTDCGIGAVTTIYLAERDREGRWSPPERVEPNLTTALISDPLLVSDDEGNLYAEWRDESSEGTKIYASFRTRLGHWSGKWECGQ